MRYFTLGLLGIFLLSAPVSAKVLLPDGTDALELLNKPIVLPRFMNVRAVLGDCGEMLVPAIKDRFVDRMRRKFKPGSTGTYQLVDDPNAEIVQVYGKTLGTGMFAGPVLVTINKATGAFQILLDYQKAGIRLVAKMPHAYRYASPDKAIAITSAAIRSEMATYQRIVAAMPQIRLHPDYPKDAVWEHQIPIVEILGPLFESTYGAVIYKRFLVSKNLVDLAEDFTFTKLTPAMERALRHIYQFSKAIFGVAETPIQRIWPFWKPSIEPMAIDIRPDNLAFVDNADQLEALGLPRDRPLWYTYEGSEMPFNVPRYQVDVPFEKYRQTVIDYINRHRRKYLEKLNTSRKGLTAPEVDSTIAQDVE